MHRARCVAGAYGLEAPGDLPATMEQPEFAALGKYPSVTNRPEVAAAESDSLAGMCNIAWYPDGDAPPYLRVCPSVSIEVQGAVRVVYDRSYPGYGPNGVFLHPNVDESTMGRLLSCSQQGLLSCPALVGLPTC